MLMWPASPRYRARSPGRIEPLPTLDNPVYEATEGVRIPFSALSDPDFLKTQSTNMPHHSSVHIPGARVYLFGRPDTPTWERAVWTTFLPLPPSSLSAFGPRKPLILSTIPLTTRVGRPFKGVEPHWDFMALTMGLVTPDRALTNPSLKKSLPFWMKPPTASTMPPNMKPGIFPFLFPPTSRPAPPFMRLARLMNEAPPRALTASGTRTPSPLRTIARVSSVRE